MAANLDLTDGPHEPNVDRNLDDALERIDQTGDVKRKPDSPMPLFLPTYEPLARLTQKLTELRKQLCAITADELALCMRLGRAGRIIHALQTDKKRLGETASASEVPPAPTPPDPAPVAVDIDES
jgi:hypothetical protein